MDKIKSVLDNLSLDFYRCTATSKSGQNFIISPVSLAYEVIALLSVSKGSTKDRLEDFLRLNEHFGEETAPVLRAFSELLCLLKPDNVVFEDKPGTSQETATPKEEEHMVFYGDVVDDMHLILLAGIFLDSNLLIDRSAAENLFSKLKVLIQQVDFGNVEASRSTINAWIAQETSQKVQKIISVDALGASPEMILASTMYLRAPWSEKFRKSQTSKKTFFCGDGTEKQVDMMAVQGHFVYTERPEMELQYLELDYSAGDASMLVLLPRRHNGLPEAEGALSPALLSDLANNADHTKEVHVELPRFRLDSALDLKDVLTESPLSAIFSAYADFSGLFGQAQAHPVSGAFHKVHMEINEDGTEVKASHPKLIRLLSELMGQPAPTEFIANRPFFFAIRHNSTNTILFVGRIENPD